MRIYFARHGQSEANILRVMSNRELAHPLTELGRQQAAALAEQLLGRGIAHIYTSPIPRARQTAAIVGAALGVPVTAEDGLREPDCGASEGRSDPAAWAEHSAAWDAWRAGDLARTIAGGESFLDVRARFVPLVERLLAADHGGDLLLVGHGMLYITMLPLVLANIDPDYAYTNQLGNTAFVLAETCPGGLVCREWCGVALSSSS